VNAMQIIDLQGLEASESESTFALGSSVSVDC
jgi:hypothetical protein